MNNPVPEAPEALYPASMAGANLSGVIMASSSPMRQALQVADRGGAASSNGFNSSFLAATWRWNYPRRVERAVVRNKAVHLALGVLPDGYRQHLAEIQAGVKAKP